MKPRHWLVFVALSVFWGSSFFWIKIALQELGPLSLVTHRVLFGVCFGAILMFSQGIPWPRTWSEWKPYVVLSLVNLSIPYFLLTWGERTVDSAVASILNATTPLFTIVIATFFLHDDKINTRRLVGLLLGFAGVVVLLSKDLDPGVHSPLLGQLACAASALCYAVGVVYIRHSTQPGGGVVGGTAPLASAALIMIGTTYAVEGTIAIPVLPITWVALFWLGVLGAGLSLILYFYLVHEIGPTRASMVTYVLPPIGVLLGVLFLDETLTWQLGAGSLLIFASLAVVNGGTSGR